jgi:hypothetical protein
MKFSATVFLAALAASASAFVHPRQDASSTSVGSATPVSVSLTPQQTCISKCDPADVTCQAACVGTARPNESQVNQTTECAMKCDQGDGSPAATEKYSQCVQGCIASYFPSSQTVSAPAGTPANSAASNAASATGAAASAASSGASAAQTPTESELPNRF